MMSKIGLFPAAGRLGTSIYTHLLKIVDPAQVILISRKPETIASEHALNVAATRKANYDDLESLKMAFNGITYLILISYPSLEFEHRVKVSQNYIDTPRKVVCTDLSRSTEVPLMPQSRPVSRTSSIHR